MNCIFKVYAGFCLLLKNCKCSKIGSNKGKVLAHLQLPKKDI